MAPRRKVRVVIPSPSPVAPSPAAPPPAVPDRTPGQGEARQNLTPIVITGGDFDVDLTNAGRQPRPALVKVGNVSNFLLEITLGGHRDYIGPGETNVLPTNGVTQMHVHPMTVTTPAS